MLNTYTDRKAAFIVPAGTIKRTTEKKENKQTRKVIMAMAKSDSQQAKWSFNVKKR